MTGRRAQPRAQRIQQAIAKLAGQADNARAALAAEPGSSADPSKHAELWLYGIVGGYWFGFNSKSVADQLRGLDVDTITVRLHSPGGSIVEGIAISNLLRNHKATVTVVVDGLAASIASIIAMGGDEIVMSPGSQMMIHDGMLFTAGNEKELRQDADYIGKQSTNLAEIYAGRAAGTAAEWRARMTADDLGEGMGTWYTAQEAVDAGLADRVGTVIAVTAAPEPPDDSLLEDDEMFDRAAACAALDLDVLITPAARAAWPYQPPTASAEGSTPTEGGSAVAFSDEQMTNLREKLGLAETADETAIVTAVNAVVEESLEERPKTETPQIPDGMSLVDSAVLEQIKADATAGRDAQRNLAGQARDAAINQALKDGKITAASRDKFVEAWDKDPATAKALLDTLTPGLVPTAEAGHQGEPAALDADDELYALVYGDEKKGA